MEILTPLVFQPRPLFKKILKKLQRLWKNKPYDAGDGTQVRSGDNWKPMNDNTTIINPANNDSLANIYSWVWK
jgi:hypothetical protein